MTDAIPLLRLLGATLAVGVLPGVLVTLLWKPRPELTAMETVGFGSAMSFGLIQLMAILAIAAHAPPTAGIRAMRPSRPFVGTWIPRRFTARSSPNVNPVPATAAENTSRSDSEQ